MKKEKKAIPDMIAMLMIGTALFFDVIQIIIGWIPVVGNAIADIFSLFAFLTFFLWFMMYGIKMISPKRLAAMATGGLLEMIPYLNLLPAWTGVVVYLIGTTKIKEMAEKHPTLAKGAMAVGGKVKSMQTQTPRVPFVDDTRKEMVSTRQTNYPVTKNWKESGQKEEGDWQKLENHSFDPNNYY